jgi:glycerol uptake facilitator-like aquaporin
VAEAFATAVLVWLVGYLAANNHGDKIPFAVGAWVVAASLYTSTGAQANPAVTFGLLFTGADLNYVGTIVVAELVGLVVALLGVTFVTNTVVAKAAKKSKKK